VVVADVFLGRRYSNIVLMFGIINEPYADVPTLQNLCVVSLSVCPAPRSNSDVVIVHI